MALYVQIYQPPPEKHDPSKAILFLVHGDALSHRMYKDVVPHLSALGYTVLAPDLPGHGQSVSAGPFSFATSTNLLHGAITTRRQQDARKLVLAGVSLGGQAVLDLLAHHPDCADAALVSGAPIHAPDERAPWEMPHMPTSPAWIELMTEDVNAMGMENAQGVQAASFAFDFTPPSTLPPILVVVGEEDVAMARRDLTELGELVKRGNGKSRAMVLDAAWHNHPIDVPERFAAVIDDWARSSLS